MPRLKPLVKGALSFAIPGLRSTHAEVGLGASDPDYCYSLFLRHFSYLRARGAGVPRRVAELGPGSSIGTGLAALLAGAQAYVSLDTQSHLDVELNLRNLDRLVELFGERRAPADHGVYATIFPPPLEPGFPADLQPDLDPARIARIADELRTGGGETIRIVAPWRDADVPEASVDWLWSQSCLEHVDEIDETLVALKGWLAPGGVTTHEIDYSSHSLTADWDGHWGVDARLWRMLRGRRPYLINRRPNSFYVSRLRELGFDIETELHWAGEPRTPALPEFGLIPGDREIAMSFLVCRKPH